MRIVVKTFECSQITCMPIPASVLPTAFIFEVDKAYIVFCLGSSVGLEWKEKGDLKQTNTSIQRTTKHLCPSFSFQTCSTTWVAAVKHANLVSLVFLMKNNATYSFRVCKHQAFFIEKSRSDLFGNLLFLNSSIPLFVVWK